MAGKIGKSGGSRPGAGKKPGQGKKYIRILIDETIRKQIDDLKMVSDVSDEVIMICALSFEYRYWERQGMLKSQKKENQDGQK